MYFEVYLRCEENFKNILDVAQDAKRLQKVATDFKSDWNNKKCMLYFFMINMRKIHNQKPIKNMFTINNYTVTKYWYLFHIDHIFIIRMLSKQHPMLSPNVYNKM